MSDPGLRDRVTNDRRGKLWGTALMWIAAGLFALSMPCVFGGVLGLLGVLADVGPEENRQIGVQSLRLAAIPMGLSVAALVVALVVRRSRAK